MSFMLFKYQGKPARLLRLFKSYRGMALRLREHRVEYRRKLNWLSIFYLLAVGFGLMVWSGELSIWFWLFTAAGLSFLMLTWGYCSLFRRFPTNRKTLGTRVGLGLLLLLASFIAFNVIASFWQDLIVWPTTLVGLTEILPQWGLASLGVWVASRWITWLRLRDEAIQEYELEFLDKLLNPLLRDLPPDAACTLLCNPFTPMWSEHFSSKDIGPKRLKICDDVLLDFQVKLTEESSLSLQTLHRRVDKYKIRKMKYKGTKHRLAMVCRFRHPALKGLGEAQLQKFGQVCKSMEGTSGKYATTVRRILADGKVAVVTKGRISANRDLDAEDLPKVQEVLKPIRLLSAFIASLQTA
jgi:hypothetical protein